MRTMWRNLRMQNAQSFFKQHARLLAFIGAIIVFATFVVKENLEEGWRHVADVIDTAQYMYGIRSDTRRGLNRLSELRIQLMHIHDIVDKGAVRTHDPQTETYLSSFLACSLSVDDNNVDLMTINILIKTL